MTSNDLGRQVELLKRDGKRIVFTNGCFDILHAGHVSILERARALGDYLIVGLNSDASVRRLKGAARPIHDQEARAAVLRALRSVDEVVIFDEDTPAETIAALRPDIHVKGGDYTPGQLPEAAVVQSYGGEVVILPLVEGYSTTAAVEKSTSGGTSIIIPARYGSTRFPGKPLVKLPGQTVIERVVRAALTTGAQRPIIVATDDDRIAAEVAKFPASEAVAVMTSPECHTGTDRLAEAVRARLGEPEGRTVIVNVQGDEPFIKAEHVDALIQLMASNPKLRMATLATPILDPAQETDPNVVKAVVDSRGRALYFSRATLPYDRDAKGARRLRHLGIYAYEAKWLLEMAALPPSPLEETEKLEQLRALEAGIEIGVAIVEDVVPIAIDTPEDLERAEAYMRGLK